MNQILVTQKLYITPELKRKKIKYKIMFFCSIFMIIILSSYYIYAEYDKNKSEEISKYILAEYTSFDVEDNTVINVVNDVLIVSLDSDEETTFDFRNNITSSNNADNNSNNGNNNNNSNNNGNNNRSSNNNNNSNGSSENMNVSPDSQQSYTAPDGTRFKAEAILNIESLGIKYPVLSETSEELLKISLNKYWGPNPNEIGNYCIVGHNYKNGKMFGKLSKIEVGDKITLTDANRNTLKYVVYNKYVVSPSDVRCTSQLTGGKREVTLITCSNYGTQRLIVKCTQI